MYGNQVFDETAGCNFPVISYLLLFGQGFGVLLGWKACFALLGGLMGSN